MLMRKYSSVEEFARACEEEDRAAEAANLAAKPEQRRPANDNGADKDNGAEIEFNATPFTLVDPSTLPQRDILYGGHLYRKYASATVGAGGGGKSAHSITEALEMVTGRPLFDQQGPRSKPLRVWLINLEDPLEEMTRRLHAAAKHFKVTNEHIGGRLFMDSGRDQPVVVAEQDGRKIKIVEPVIEALAVEIFRREIDVIIIDPFVSTHRVSENDNGAMQHVMTAWVEIADKCKCAVELVHHVVKSHGPVTAESARGGGAIKDKVRSLRVINPMSDEAAEKAGVPLEDAWRYFRVSTGKSNMSKGGQGHWRRLASVQLGNGTGTLNPGDEVGVVEAWTWPSADDMAERALAERAAILADVSEDDFETIKIRLGTSDHRADVRAKLWAGKQVAEILGLDAKEDRDKIKEMLAVWLERGELESVEIWDSHARRSFTHIKPA